MSQTMTQQPTNPFSARPGPFAGVSHGTQAWSNATLPQGAVPITKYRPGILSQRGLSTASKPSTAFPGTGHRLDADLDRDQDITSMPIEASECDAFEPHDDTPHDDRHDDRESSRGGGVGMSAREPLATSMRASGPERRFEENGHDDFNQPERSRSRVHWKDEVEDGDESSRDSDEGVRIIVKFPDNPRRAPAARSQPFRASTNQTKQGAQGGCSSESSSGSGSKIARLENDLQSAKTSLPCHQKALDRVSSERDDARATISQQRDKLEQWAVAYDTQKRTLDETASQFQAVWNLAVRKSVELQEKNDQLWTAQETLKAYEDKLWLYRMGTSASVPSQIDRDILR